MSVQRWIFILMLALLLPALAACGGGDAATSPGNEYGTGGSDADSSSTVGADGVDRSRLADELYFYNWSDYIDPELLEAFEAEYDVRVILDTFDSNEDMIAKVRAGNSGYDIVVPSDYAIQIMSEENLLLELDRSLLTNYGTLEPDLLGLYFDPANTVSMPYFYGITGIAYNRAELEALGISTPVDSWALLFDPALASQISGRFSMLDDERETPGAVLRWLGHSVNETDAAILAETQQILIDQKPFLASYSSSDVNRRLAGGEYIAAHSWSGTAVQARSGLEGEFSGNPDIEFVIPREGGVIWMDNLAILADSPNAYTAHVFINFLMRPEVAARNAEWVGYLTPNAEAVDLLSDEIKELYAEGFAPTDETIGRLEWIERNEATAAFTDVWTVVKGE
jgi:spermidine/putrescine transport system substrate-binding protein